MLGSEPNLRARGRPRAGGWGQVTPEASGQGVVAAEGTVEALPAGEAEALRRCPEPRRAGGFPETGDAQLSSWRKGYGRPESLQSCRPAGQHAPKPGVGERVVQKGPCPLEGALRFINEETEAEGS